MLVVLRFGMLFLVCSKNRVSTRMVRIPDHWETKFSIVELFGSVPGYNRTNSTPRGYPEEILATNLVAHV
jgi:hypothetical protein